MDLLDDDDIEVSPYENGHWLWDDKNEQLSFKCETIVIPDDIPITSAILGSIEFREDIDLNEQQRFRKRIQRKAAVGEEDIVTLQDIKDVVLFTAPAKIMNPPVIKLLHQPATERFLRALIFFCQYYLQIADVMTHRKHELEKKIRTPCSDATELQYREDLEDLRLLVAKEYSNFLVGAGDFAAYHHMGTLKRAQSLTKKESLLFETFIRISIQIVWIALGRKSFTQIEVEVNRLFRSQIFNLAEHKLNKPARMMMACSTANERNVLFGHCMIKKHKVNMLSPLISEVHCERHVDFQTYGVGFIKYPRIGPRFRYMEAVLAAPEHLLVKMNVIVGILGLQRSRFDIMLKEIVFQTTQSSIGVEKTPLRSASSSSTSSKRKSRLNLGQLYSDIELPLREDEILPFEFPAETLPRRRCDETQRRKWMQKVLRLRAKTRSRSRIKSDQFLSNTEINQIGDNCYLYRNM